MTRDPDVLPHHEFSSYNLNAKERAQLEDERLTEMGRNPEYEQGEWADKMMRAQDAEEGDLEAKHGKPRW
jgi:hypothetical protein